MSYLIKNHGAAFGGGFIDADGTNKFRSLACNYHETALQEKTKPMNSGAETELSTKIMNAYKSGSLTKGRTVNVVDL